MTSPAPLPSRMNGVADRIPESLRLLAGPDQGTVTLPLRLSWSGLNEFDVADPRQRLTLYRTLMDCGQREDIIRYVNAALLRRDWPRIRRLTARRLIALWERRLPELAV
ncbi:hypothetical protein ABZ754_02605 [Micromonospora purpureochromogenes]|uniref:hypothetical protein n=1 Tax=Micromonospora purpureochromogenes TaxID=47872 RepID=UPI0033F29032